MKAPRGSYGVVLYRQAAALASLTSPAMVWAVLSDS